jgi:ADP-ribosylglycohydrolase
VQPLTRVGIGALFAASAPDRALELSLSAVALTDASPRLLMAARFHLCLLIAALRGAARDTLSRDARALWASDFMSPGATSGAPAGEPDFDAFVRGGEEAAATLGQGAARPETDATDFPAEDPVAVLQRILGMVLAASGFREGLLAVVNQGGDADVRGAVYGQLAGALYGSPGIPRAWRSALLRRELLSDVADRLLVAALAPRT